MSPVEETPNWNVFLWALYELGGSEDFVDIETVFLKCFELAPQRLAWRTQPTIPDYKKCAKALQEAEARRPPLLLKTGDSFGRQLTVHGQKWITTNSTRLRAQLRAGKVVREPRRRPSSRLISEAEQTSAFAEWESAQMLPANKWQLAEMLRCSPDSDLTTWRNRLETLRSAAHAAGREGLLAFIAAVETAHADWFGGKSNE